MVRQLIGLVCLLTKTDGATHDGLNATVEKLTCKDSDHGKTNAHGKGCSEYGSSFTDTTCGYFDTADFNSAEMCCDCGGGDRPLCQDLDHGLTNQFGDGCSGYGIGRFDTQCGMFDTNDFKTGELCCVCGGGREVPQAFPDCRDKDTLMCDGDHFSGDAYKNAHPNCPSDELIMCTGTTFQDVDPGTYQLVFEAKRVHPTNSADGVARAPVSISTHNGYYSQQFQWNADGVVTDEYQDLVIGEVVVRPGANAGPNVGVEIHMKWFDLHYFKWKSMSLKVVSTIMI